MKYLKGCAVVIAFVIGSELVFRYLKRHDGRLIIDKKVYTKVLFFPDQGILSKNSSQLNSSQTSNQLENSPLGPESLNSARGSDLRIPDSSEGGQKNTSFLLPRHTNDTAVSLEANPLCLEEFANKRSGSTSEDCITVSTKTYQEIFKIPSYLFNSSSLVHMISVIETARQSLKICLYIFTCKDLIHAVIRAKVSYFCVVMK